ncbi:MAG TPA: EsaB/YukD family protein [Pseudogracilibacillus sp.]|nr:EsaB/YukD family protein [Pseudogracilibacillus sp.]
MYIHVTVDLSNYDKDMLELRLSNQHTLKKVIDIAWQVAQIKRKPREGFWVRVEREKAVFPGVHTLEQCRIMTGDRLKVL